MPRILLIDDDSVLRDILRDVLESAGYQVAEAKDGNQGIDLLRAEGVAYDLIVTDVVMPGESGMAVVKAARTHCPSAKILVISGGSHDLPAKWSLKMTEMYAVEAVVFKPFQNDEFSDLVGKLLDKKA